jgi:hypothetical protein
MVAMLGREDTAMRLFVANLVAGVLLASFGRTWASPIENVDWHVGALRPTINTRAEALAWLDKHTVTVKQFIALTGRGPRNDITALRWQFRDGAIVIGCIGLPNGEFQISCWCSAK